MISSLVVTLENDNASHAIGELNNHPAIEMGNLFENRLPVTVASVDSQEMMFTTRWIEDLTGVFKVDVVFVHFEDDPADLQTNFGQ